MTQKNYNRRLIFTGILCLILFLLIWQIILPLFGVAVGSGIINLVTLSIFLICTALLLTFILTSIGLLIIGSIVLIWTFVATLIMPFMLPILVPILIVYVILALRRRNNQRSQTKLTREP